MLVAAIGSALLIGLARWRRHWLPATVALALIVGGTVGAIHQQLIAGSTVSALADSRAVVIMEVTLSGDPDVTAGDGIKPAYLTRRATVSAVDGRGRAWRVRTPVLLTVVGDELGSWRSWPAGSQVRTVARLQSADPGSDLAALARIRGPSQLIGDPPTGLAMVERVRSGLRRAVAHRPADQRALVPALVLGRHAAIDETTAGGRHSGPG